jgi:feruloyl esterase
MALAQQAFLPYTCSAHAIGIPTVVGAKILSIEAVAVQNYSKYVFEGYYFNHASVNATNLSFCNVTVTYTHPGQNDTITTQIWSPTNSWNERMQAIGGGGWIAGMSFLSYIGMAGAVAEGYAAITTDGGHTSDNPEDWALLSPGNVNLYTLQNFASVSLNDLAIIGKSLVKSFYGAPPKFSYWSGCSQGGRQGYMLAQRYPKAFDGIAASAPAINWAQQFVADFWPQQVMNELQQYPHPCELEAITAAAIKACDGNDGIIDGLISDPDSCQFDPYKIANTTVKCSKTGTSMQVSHAAATVAKAAWAGPQTSNGTFLWYGPGYDAALTGNTSLATTECDANGRCVGKPVGITTDWMRLFVRKDPSFNVSNMTRAEFEEIFHASTQQFSSIVGTSDPNLDGFHDAGGKMLSYHGLVIYNLQRGQLNEVKVI